MVSFADLDLFVLNLFDFYMSKKAYLLALSEFTINYIYDMEDISEVRINKHQILCLYLSKYIGLFHEA